MDYSETDRKLLAFDTFLRKISYIFAWISSGTLMLLAIMVFIDVFLRDVFNSPLPAANETSLVLMPWIAFPGFICALVAGGHVRMTLVVDRLPQRIQFGFLVFSYIVAILFFTLLTVWGWMHFWESVVVWEVSVAAVPLPRWLAKLSLPLGMFVMALDFLVILLLHLRHITPASAVTALPLQE